MGLAVAALEAEEDSLASERARERVLCAAKFHDGANVLMLSKRQDEASALLVKARFLERSLPDWLRTAAGKSNDSTLEFADRGSKISALPSNEDAGRSEAATLVLLDEHAFHQYAEDNFAVKPTIDAGGRLVIVSTANG